MASKVKLIINKANIHRMQNSSGAIGHLRDHQTYPATKADLVAACSNLSDFSEEDKKEFETTLPEGSYNSAEEVMTALGLTE